MARIDTTTNVNQLVDMWVSRRFVERLESTLVTVPLGLREDIPNSTGKNIRWQFFLNLTANTTPITEGNDPAGAAQSLTTTKAEATIQEYGDWMEIAELYELTAIDGSTQELADALAYQARLSLDDIVLTELATTTNIQDAGAALTANAMKAAAQTMRTNNVAFHPATPGGNFWCLVASVEAAYDLLNEGSPVWHQAKSELIEASFTRPMMGTPEGSAIWGAIVKITQNSKRDTVASPDDDLNYLIGKEGFGVTAINTELANPRVIINRPSERRDIPLRNRGTMAWHLYFATVLIDDLRVLEILSDATGVGL